MIHTNGLHWEGFPRLAWEALSAAGYTTPPTYEVSEFERLGVPCCMVIVTVLPHPDHTDWFDLSFVYWGFITHEIVESAVLTPKIGTGRRLICGPNLVTNSVRQGKISSEDSAEMPAVGSLFPFGKRTVCAGFAGSRGDVARTKEKDEWIGIRTWALK
jgi:hypothetical protein